MRLRELGAAFALVLATSGCGARAWQQAMSLDEPAGYHRFLREHGSSGYAEEARRRLEFSRLRAQPSYEGFLTFRARYPDDPLVAELSRFVEHARFHAARAAGSIEDYQDFVDQFPDSDLRERARGNANYLRSIGFATNPAGLAAFAQKFPHSDYAAAAQRSISLVETARHRVSRVGLLMEVAAPQAGEGLLRRDFSDRARRAWQAQGVDLVEVSSEADPLAARLPALLHIQHREDEVPASMQGGEMRPPGVLAKTRIALDLGDSPERVWLRDFALRARAYQRTLDSSVLYSPGARDFWRDFFVPVALWPNGRAVAPPLALYASPVAVDLEGSRAALLFADGSFEVHDVADAGEPVLLARYRRPRDLANFDGIQLHAGRVVIHGPGGVEVVSLGPDGAKRELQLGRETVGAVRGVEFLGDSIVAASSLGLLRIQADAEPRVWMKGSMSGVARQGTYLLFGDETRIFSARAEDLDASRVAGSLRIPRGLDAVEFRTEGTRLAVLGRRGVLWVDVQDPTRLRLSARAELRDVGHVSDAADIGGRLLVLGERGLQILDEDGPRLVESLDVQARGRLSIWGRHAALVGDGQLQVVDLTPFLASIRAAKRPFQRADSAR